MSLTPFTGPAMLARSMQRAAALFSEPIGQPPDRWIHQACTPLEISSNGPFVQLDDGTLLAIDGNVMRSSRDAGRTWTGTGEPIDPGMGIGNAGHVGQFLRLRDGIFIAAYLDYAELDARGWDVEKKEPYRGSHFALWSIRSTDGGTTWRDRQKLMGGYNADFMGLIQTARGNVVITMQHLQTPIRHGVSVTAIRTCHVVRLKSKRRGRCTGDQVPRLLAVSNECPPFPCGAKSSLSMSAYNSGTRSTA